MRERPNGQGVDVLAQDPREVGDAFARSQPHVLAAEEDRIAAQAGDCRFEAHAGAQRRLLEQKPQAAAREQQRPLAALLVALELDCAIDQARALAAEISKRSTKWRGMARTCSSDDAHSAAHPPGLRIHGRSAHR